MNIRLHPAVFAASALVAKLRSEKRRNRDPKVNEWREQRYASVEATKRELRTMPRDPITAAVMGVQQRQQGGGE
jgi:hypothetical protein